MTHLSYEVLTDQTYHVPVDDPTPGCRYGRSGGYRTVLQTFDDAVAYATVNKIVGVSKTDKVWIRWHKNHVYKFRMTPTKDGLIRPNLLEYEKGRVFNQNMNLNVHRNVPKEFLDKSLQALRDAGAYAVENYHSWRQYPLLYSMYPVLGELMPLDDEQHITYFRPVRYISRHLRELDTAEFTRSAFGQGRYRKDLVKAVAGASNIELIDYAAMWRGLVPTDWIITLLNSGDNLTGTGMRYTDYTMKDITLFRQLLSQMTDARKRSLIRSSGANWRETFDVMSGLRGYLALPQHSFDDLKDLRNFHEIHEIQYPRGEYRAYVPTMPANREITQTDRHVEINNLNVGVEDLSLLCSIDSDMMYTWSSQMNNCIRGYVHQAVSDTGIYIGIYQKDKLVGNIELRHQDKKTDPMELVQILGKYNQDLPDSIRRPVVEALRNANIIGPVKSKTVWGLHDEPEWVIALETKILMNSGIIQPATTAAIHLNYVTTQAIDRFDALVYGLQEMQR